MPTKLTPEMIELIEEAGQFLVDFCQQPLQRGADLQEAAQRLRQNPHRRDSPELVLLIGVVTDLARRCAHESTATAMERLLSEYRNRSGFGRHPHDHAHYPRWRRQTVTLCEQWRAGGGSWPRELTEQMAELAEALSVADNKGVVAA